MGVADRHDPQARIEHEVEAGTASKMARIILVLKGAHLAADGTGMGAIPPQTSETR